MSSGVVRSSWRRRAVARIAGTSWGATGPDGDDDLEPARNRSAGQARADQLVEGAGDADDVVERPRPPADDRYEEIAGDAGAARGLGVGRPAQRAGRVVV